MTDPSHPIVGELLTRCSFPPPGSPVVCAVSGGPDSMALMVLASAHGLDVRVVHVDHGLRPGSAADADVVRAAAGSLGIGVEVHVLDLEPGPNLEARAREARYAVMPEDVLTGHTADDQAETLLLNLLRGAGPRGLAGMRRDSGRPLLGLRRSETRLLCDRLAIAVVDDETNGDPRFQRNRVRHELVPLLASVSRRDPVPILVRTADVLRDEDDLLDELAAALDPTDARALCGAPLPLARRAVRLWLSDPYPPDQATVERVLAVARGEALACDIGGNREIRRSKQQLSVRSVR